MNVDEKQVIFWSADYAKRAKMERQPASRPVYVSRKEHIEAHFLTCYIALVLSRVLQHKLDKKYSVGKTLESLSKCNCSHIENNYYLFNYYDKVLEDVGKALNINFSCKYRRLQDIKKILGNCKKM